jgi:hypothetical protein
MMTRILRPLLWFGLLESKPEGEAGFAVPHVYRKAAVLPVRQIQRQDRAAGSALARSPAPSG